MTFEMRSWRDWSAGDRVVVRRRLAGEEASGHRWTDVIGVVLAVDDSGLTLRPDTPRDGQDAAPVRVAADDVVSAKRVPPRPARRVSAARPGPAAGGPSAPPRG
ncbi:DUF6725 family protein [Luteimicrobium sp. DT211]|uniref:DUF6725 family protein n=1 Tax=Luteimicrobium sp. DT211 TaxID=3393412 RepID=UPI003CFB5C1D